MTNIVAISWIKIVIGLIQIFERYFEEGRTSLRSRFLFKISYLIIPAMLISMFVLARLSETHFLVLLPSAICIFVSGYIFGMMLLERGMRETSSGASEKKRREKSSSDVSLLCTLALISIVFGAFFKGGNIWFSLALEALVFFIGLIFGSALLYLFNYRKQHISNILTSTN